jgi:hypothetical protein
MDTGRITYNAIRGYDEAKGEFEEKITDAVYIQREGTISGSTNYITFYDKDKHKIHRVQYEYCGMYIHHKQCWVWGWAIPNITRSLKSTARKLLNYGLDMESNEILSVFFITSRYQLKDKLHLDILLSNAWRYSKCKTIYELKMPYDISFYTLTEKDIMKLKEFQHKGFVYDKSFIPVIKDTTNDKLISFYLFIYE